VHVRPLLAIGLTTGSDRRGRPKGNENPWADT
jgi:hypothetical protein